MAGLKKNAKYSFVMIQSQGEGLCGAKERQPAGVLLPSSGEKVGFQGTLP
jgi:hypothetical protein